MFSPGSLVEGGRSSRSRRKAPAEPGKAEPGKAEPRKAEPRKARAKAPKKTKAKAPAKTKAKAPAKPKAQAPAQPSPSSSTPPTLPRSRQTALLASGSLCVLGVDEAGRGPLCGPVVVGAVHYPASAPPLPGICDSKQLADEAARDGLFAALAKTPGVRYAAAIVSPERIDEVNILQATCEGMRMAANAVLRPDEPGGREPAGPGRGGDYVVVGGGGEAPGAGGAYALVDGNRFPNFRDDDLEKRPEIRAGGRRDILCPGEAMVKGDGREFVIGAASIVAKVTRDRLMREYDKLYPEWNMRQHKGYPTKEHVAAVWKHGASPIHRRTFAPLKNMEFNEDGSVKR
jgi:ribonuclease HII